VKGGDGGCGDDDEDDDDDDDEKRHVLGKLILRKHRCENLKYRFELDGFFFG
jgi:hypothetical protein